MDVKRFFVFGILGLFMISMMSGVLGVEHIDGRAVGEAIVTNVGGFLEPFLAPFFGDQEMLSRVFFAILLGMIIFSIIGTIFGETKPWIQWGITFAITSLSLIGLPTSFLEAIRVQYAAMGATILTIIPFMIIVVFSLRAKNVLIARMTWIFYAVYYFVMYLYAIITSTSGTGWFSIETLPYLAGFVAGIFLFFGMTSIRNLIFRGKIEGIMERGMNKVEKRKALQAVQDADLGRYAS